jgi:hypothetical protein
MFVPSAESLMHALNINKSAFQGDGRVELPAKFFKFLLQMALATVDFDEDTYLLRNVDVAQAVKRGEIENARLHYIGFGYFEGRQGAGPDVDEIWYLQNYPDVAVAIEEKRVSSANEHFHAIGAGEGRSPNAEYLEDAQQWKEILSRA